MITELDFNMSASFKTQMHENRWKHSSSYFLAANSTTKAVIKKVNIASRVPDTCHIKLLRS
jgi:hypothetical protein